MVATFRRHAIRCIRLTRYQQEGEHTLARIVAVNEFWIRAHWIRAQTSIIWTVLVASRLRWKAAVHLATVHNCTALISRASTRSLAVFLGSHPFYMTVDFPLNYKALYTITIVYIALAYFHVFTYSYSSLPLPVFCPWGGPSLQAQEPKAAVLPKAGLPPQI